MVQTPLVEFAFGNDLATAANENITIQQSGDIAIRIWRSMRVSPMPGMKQPLLNKAIMGMESVMEMLLPTGPARCYRWILRRNDKIVQRGTTNEHGISSDLNIELSDEGVYSISIFSPKSTKPRKIVESSL